MLRLLRGSLLPCVAYAVGDRSGEAR